MSSFSGREGSKGFILIEDRFIQDSSGWNPRGTGGRGGREPEPGNQPSERAGGHRSPLARLDCDAEGGGGRGWDCQEEK